MMKKIFSVLMIILFTAPCVFAAEDILPKPDKNNDGKISQREYMDAVTETFNQLDKNKDGMLTREEIQSNDKINVDPFIKETDADNDGRIIKKEYAQAALKKFKQLDKNKNGFIDKHEWSVDRSPAYSPFTLFTF